MKQKTCIWLILFIVTIFLAGCKGNKLDQKKEKDIEYTVTSEDRLPEELRVLIDGKKEEPFKMTYRDGEYLYICQGYGMQSTGGYSIQVEAIYRTSNAIYFSSSLIGPSQSEMRTENLTYPYIVIKIEYQDMTVVFD